MGAAAAALLVPTTVAQATTFPGFDLSITESATPNPATAGQVVHYTVTTHNAGPQDVFNNTVNITVPSDASTPTNITPSQGTCSFSSATNIRCLLGRVNAGHDATITFDVTPTAPGTMTNTVRITDNTANGGDTNPNNNVFTLNVPVNPPPKSVDLATTISASQNPNAVGSSYDYTVVFKNNGPDDSSGTGTVTVPSNTSINGTPSGCSVSGRTVTCVYDPMPNGASHTVVIHVTANSKNTAAEADSDITGPDPDPNLDNNHASVTTATYQSFGSAYGEQVRAILNSGPLPTVSQSTPGTQSISVLATDQALAKLLIAHALTASTTVNDDASVTSTATTADANLLQGVLQATAIQATCSSTAPGQVTGDTTFASLSIGGHGGNLNPPANTVIPLPGNITITLNEQIPANGGLTVNAVHVHIPAFLILPATDIIISHVECLVDP